MRSKKDDFNIQQNYPGNKTLGVMTIKPEYDFNQGNY